MGWGMREVGGVEQRLMVVLAKGDGRDAGAEK